MEGLSKYEKESRPWGSFERFTLNEASTVKLITVSPNSRLSLQTHGSRDEYWRVLAGTGEVTVGEQTFPANAGSNFRVMRGVQHRIQGGTEGIVILEIALGEFSEDDITRLADDYGRI